MRRHMCRLAACWIVSAVAGCSSSAVESLMGAEPRGPLADLAWLSGAWVSVDGDGTAEEVWTKPGGGTMLGLNRTVIRGRAVSFEYLRIEETPQGIVYLASPGGRSPPTPFALVRTGPKEAVFENPDHDFPTRIVYRRRGNTLEGRIEGELEGKPMSREWTWRRTSMDAMPH